MAEPTPVEQWRLERYREGDETEILGLFTAVFGKARSLEHWRWQFKANPYGGPFASLARDARDRRVVGSYSVMPMMLNLTGRPVPACQSVDTAVHADFRGQRIFEKTAGDCYAWCAESGLQAVVGFPNAASYPGFVRNLGWKRIVFPTYWVMRLSLAGGVNRVLGLPFAGAVVDFFHQTWLAVKLAVRETMLRRLTAGELLFAASRTCPASYEKFWNAWRAQEYLSLWKDTKYFQWRYDANPDHEFTYYTLARGGELAAIAVGVEIDRALVLCELMVAGRDVNAGRLLANRICDHALSHGLRAVTFLGHDAGVFRDVLDTFESSTSYTNVFGGRAFVEGPLGEALPHANNWTVTFGDGDFV